MTLEEIVSQKVVDFEMYVEYKMQEPVPWNPYMVWWQYYDSLAQAMMPRQPAKVYDFMEYFYRK